MTARRRWGFAGATVLVVLLLVLTPPLLNVNRYQRRIASSMSASLGRPVHLDRVSLHLLPFPGFTLENLVVSEDPAFGNEPVIRANVVEARLRPSSLWRRQVEFSRLRFEEPSLNLVHNAQGRWNVQSLLMHAAAVESAPTAQQRAGPSPRFPYIEAIGARVNVKMGDEKLPFSLTDCDFALWLPSPERWRLRLEGKPARTDTSISDPGLMTLEGSLDRPQGNGGDITRVPVDLHATWHRAPLGEATKVVTGEDQNWRGNLSVETALTGKLDEATLTTTVHVEDLHRADFYPARTVDLQLLCTAKSVVTAGMLRDLQCDVPVDGTQAIHVSSAALERTAASPQRVDIAVTQLPVAWVVDWMRLWSPRIPVKPVEGRTDGMLALERHADGWTMSGDLDMTLPKLASASPKAVVPPAGLHWTVVPATGAVLTPLNLTSPDGTDVTIAATLTPEGSQYSLDGVATSTAVAPVLAYLPPLADGLTPFLAKESPAKSAPVGQLARIDVSCNRRWEQEQSCVANEPVATPKPRRRKR